MRILDAGCGFGRNLVYLLKAGYEVPATNFRVEAVEEMSFPTAFADVILSSAMLHVARDDHHFEAMLAEVDEFSSREACCFAA